MSGRLGRRGEGASLPHHRLPPCPPLCIYLSPSLPPLPLSPCSGTTTLARAHLNNEGSQQDTDPWRTACSPVGTSKFKYQAPVSPQQSLYRGGSPLRQIPLEEVRPPPPTAISRDSLSSGLDPQRGSPRKADYRPSSRESRASIREGAPLCHGLKEGPNAGAQDQKSSVIPDNIRHKFGSDMVDELVSEEQVSERAQEAEGGRWVQHGDLGGPPRSLPSSTESLQ